MFEQQQPGADYTVISLSDRPPPASDRREGQRHMTVLQAGKIVTAHSQELCLIRNISSRGMMAEIFSEFEVDDRVDVEFKAGTRTGGIVRWVEAGRAGVEFDAPIDVHAVLAPNTAALAPRAPRLSIDGTVGVEIEDERFSLPVTDISQGGMKVLHDGELDEIGLEVTVSIEGLPIRRAIVRWSEDGAAGIEFRRVMPLDRIAYWAAKQNPMSREEHGERAGR